MSRNKFETNNIILSIHLIALDGSRERLFIMTPCLESDIIDIGEYIYLSRVNTDQSINNLMLNFAVKATETIFITCFNKKIVIIIADITSNWYLGEHKFKKNEIYFLES